MIDQLEFAKVMGYVATAINKPVTAEAIAIYYDLLGDLPLDVLQAAARKVVLEHKWATFPSVAELRDAAVLLMGQTTDLPAAEAWRLAWRIAACHDPEIRGPYIVNGNEYESQWDYLTRDVPPLVLKAMQSYGVSALCYSREEPTGVTRAHFFKIYDQLQQAERREALLPESLKADMRRIQDKPSMPVLNRIGVMPES